MSVRRLSRFASPFLLFGADMAVESLDYFTGERPELRPGDMRRLVLTFANSIQGKLPELLGDDDAERVATLKTVLHGTSDDDLIELMSLLQSVLAERSDGPQLRSRRRASSRADRRASKM